MVKTDVPATRIASWEGISRSVRSAFGVLLECIVVSVIVALTLEGISRAIHWGVRPMLPGVTDEAVAARMPAQFDSWISVYGGPRFRVCTDDYGLRTITCGEDAQAAKVLSVGDSQAFGWGMDYAESFTVNVAQSLGVGESGARSMAAGGADLEGLFGWAQDYRAQLKAGAPARLNIVVVNLGNDLDEMYFGRTTFHTLFLKSLRKWLTVHSYFILDFTLLKNKLFSISEWYLPPGANPVVMSLTHDERAQLALGTTEAAMRLVRALPPAQDTVVLLLPQDYQVAKSEFAKYRKFYPGASQFESWNVRVDEASVALNEIEQLVKRGLQSQGVMVVTPRQQLAGHDPLLVFDRNSHHYTAFGQKIIARAMLDVIQAQSGARFESRR